MEIVAARRLAQTLLREHGLPDWHVVVDRAKTRAGVCRPHRHEIGLSGPLTALHDEAEVRDTILHEIAHALVGPSHGHDAVWRQQALAIGCTAQRCTDAESPRLPAPWVGTCPGGHTVQRHRRPDTVASCRRCAPRFDPRCIFEWTHHGQPVEMPPDYATSLRAISPGSPLPAPVGAGVRVRVTAIGRYHGVTGTVLERAPTRYHVHTPAGVLAVPFAYVEPA